MLPPHGRDQRSLHRAVTNVCSKRLISYIKGMFQVQRYRCIHCKRHVLSSCSEKTITLVRALPLCVWAARKAIFEQVSFFLFLVYAHIMLTFSQMIAEAKIEQTSVATKSHWKGFREFWVLKVLPSRALGRNLEWKLWVKTTI